MADPSVTIALYALYGSIVTAFMSSVVAVLIAWLNYKQEARAKVQAEAVAEVKTTLQSNTEATTKEMADLKVVTDKTHAAVNGSMGVAMRLHWTQAERIASLTGDPADKLLAQQAKEAYEAHEQKAGHDKK